MKPDELHRKQFHALADALDETPQTLISIHILRRGMCRAWLAGEPTAPHATVIQPTPSPAEPLGFGRDPDLLWNLLREVPGWGCILVDTQVARPLARRIRDRTQHQVGFVDDIYFVLRRPAGRYADPAVRFLTPDDAPLVDAAPPELAGVGYPSRQAFLADAVAAAAIVDGRIVSLAYTSALGDRYADIGVYTAPAFRNRGFARAAASLVADRVQHQDRVPVWSTGHFNAASLHIARQLGFVETGRRTYVVLDTLDAWQFARPLGRRED
jgi:GNAT superfamily N-acetyltransferase